MKIVPTTFPENRSQSSSATPVVEPGIKALSPPEPVGPGITDRRKTVRTLPIPLAVESDRDSDWALFEALISKQSKR